MIKKLIFVISAVFVFALFAQAKAFAADANYNALRVGDYINVLRDFDHIDTGNRIYDNGQLHIATDDYLYLDASKRVYFQNEAYFTRNTDGWDGSQSKIYDNGQLHIATDDYLYLDAPISVTAQNDLIVNNHLYTKDLTIKNGLISTDSASYFTNSNINFVNAYVNFTHARVDFTDAEIIGLDNNATSQSDTVIYADSGIDVNNGNFIINSDGSSSTIGNMTLDNDAVLTVNNMAYFGDIIALSGNYSLSRDGNLSARGVIDFSGAVSLLIPNSLGAPNACEEGKVGQVYYDTTLGVANGVYVCSNDSDKDGVADYGWLIIN